MDIRNDTKLLRRFFKKITVSGDCHVWSGAINRGGYGSFNIEGTIRTAHRVAYFLAHGPYDESMHVDHVCHNRACVNPDHLRLVTRKQNAENRQGPTRHNTSGFRGVSWNTAAKKWIVSAGHGRVKHYGGVYESLEEADAAARALRNRLFTHNITDRQAS